MAGKYPRVLILKTVKSNYGAEIFGITSVFVSSVCFIHNFLNSHFYIAGECWGCSVYHTFVFYWLTLSCWVCWDCDINPEADKSLSRTANCVIQSWTDH